MPLPRYFSVPSRVVGAVLVSISALNCWPNSQSRHRTHGVNESQLMPRTIVIVKPEYGLNYTKGFIGFTFDDQSFVSNGIAWFTRWEEGENPDARLFNKKRRFICSELAAYALNQQPEYHGKGILAQRPFSIDLQELFQDRVIFEPWSETVKGTIQPGQQYEVG
jgi:hypothetical protein